MQINPLLNVCKYFFPLCIFYKTHAVRLSTLKLMTANYCSLASKCVYNVSAETSNFFVRQATWSECVVFICATLTGRSKRKQTLTAKKYDFFLYEARLTYKSFNLLSVILSLSAEIICKCTSIDVSLSFIAWHGFTCMACVRPCNSN